MNIVAPKVQLKILTQSSVRAFRKCQRAYENGYVKLVRPAVDHEALRFGSIWHEIRERWWIEQAIAHGRMVRTSSTESTSPLGYLAGLDLDPYIKVQLACMLGGYHQRWSGMVSELDIIGTEVPFDLPVTNPTSNKDSRTWRMQGKIDGVVRENGNLWVVEEKTARGDLTPESAYWRRLEVDPQCSTYYSAVQKIYGEVPAGILYFVNVKPQVRPYKATPTDKRRYTAKGWLDKRQHDEDESPEAFMLRLGEHIAEQPERYYQLVRVMRLERDIRESELDIWHTAKAIHEADKSGVYLRNPDSCINLFGQSCNYLPVCTNRASLDDAGLYRRSDTPHEELVG
jgi:hypothetical protein